MAGMKMPNEPAERKPSNQRVMEQLLEAREATNKLAQTRNSRLDRIHLTVVAFG
jgi:hypothetical protein